MYSSYMLDVLWEIGKKWQKWIVKKMYICIYLCIVVVIMSREVPHMGTFTLMS